MMCDSHVELVREMASVSADLKNQGREIKNMRSSMEKRTTLIITTLLATLATVAGVLGSTLWQ